MNISNKIEGLFKDYAENYYFSGAGLVKQGNEIIYSGAYGYAHRGFKIENNLNTRFDTASITKLFTSVGIFQLVEQGKLDLHDRILEITEIKDTAIPKEVEIYHLLNHTSGIADDADEEAGEDYEDIWREKPNYSVRETSDFLPQFIHKKPNFMPGQGHRYNNVGYILLGLAIEKITGLKYRDYIIQNVFKPAGMHDTDFCSMDGIFENVAEGYVMIEDEAENCTGWRKNIYSYPPVGSPDGGAYSTVGDLDRFIRSLRNCGLLSDSLTREIFNPQMVVKELDTFNLLESYGFGVVSDKSGVITNYYKTGSNAGVADMFVYYPSLDTTVAILANQTCNVWKLNREVKELLLNK